MLQDRGFGRLKVHVAKIKALCYEVLGANEIDEISLDEPTGPLDELYFRKTVAWSYALFYESGVFFRYSKRLLRGRDPNGFKQMLDTMDTVRAARTVHGHNLRSDRTSDQATRRRFDIWLLTNGGTPTKWRECIEALIDDSSSNGRLDRWRRLVEFFHTRQSAEEAVGRALRKELTDVFGGRQ